MKRIAALICALALLLTACGPGPGPESGTSGAAATAEPTKTEAPATKPAPTEVPATEAPATEPAPSYTASGSRTAGGVLVHTDPSAYRPYQGAGAKYSRLRPGALEDFEPSADYGAVYPYVATRLMSAESLGFSWDQGSVYGFVDGSGRILTDGVYMSIAAMRSFNEERRETNQLPYWITSRVTDPIVHREQDGDDSYYWVEADIRYGVVSMDGSFALPCVYSQVTVLEDSFVCWVDGSDTDFEIYDAAGQLRFTGEQLRDGDEAVNSFWIDDGDGLYLTRFYYPNESLCWFCDREGNKVLGPYRDAGAFSEGLAAASTDGVSFGYIDKTGYWVIDQEYRSCYSFRHGRSSVSTWDDRTLMLDREGKLVMDLGENGWFYEEACGFQVCSEETETNSFYDDSGRLLYRGSEDALCLDADSFLDLEPDGRVRIFRLSGEELIFESSRHYYSAGVELVDGEPVSGYEDYDYETGTIWFVPRDLSGVLEVGPPPTPVPGYLGSYVGSFSSTDQVTGERWNFCWNGEAWIGLSESGEQLTIPLRATQIIMRGERIMCMTDAACLYLDRQGETVFCYPLDAQD